MNALLWVVFVIFGWFVGCFGQEVPGCKSKSTCSECIQEFGCVWCSDPVAGKDHCASVSESNQQWCRNPNKIISPKSSYEILEDKPLRSAESRNEDAVQIRPQRIKLRVRRDEEHQISFQYRQASNYPVDLYYLMDLSKSMNQHKNKLSVLGGQIASTMRNLTNNFRLGFGSFVDKVTLPFVSTEPSRLKHPCDGCIPAYSYKNHMSLSEDEEKFSEEVKKATVSGNLDSPEGGFDALMQVMTCLEEIGWRSQARRLIVFFTDEIFHISGDGKLAGVVEPNDGRCHMENNMYTHSLIYDYPSISHINYVAKMNNFNLIFAVAMTHQSTSRNKKYVRHLYGELEQIIENSKSTVVYDDSDDVVNSIIDNYNRIVRSIIMTTPNYSNDVQVRFVSNCKEPIANGAGCNNTRVTEVLNFTAIIKPISCPKDGKPIIVQIQPGTVKEYLTIELEVICDCDCEDPGHSDYEKDSDSCSGNGDLKCGVCSCREERFGTKCECDRRNSTLSDTSACKKHPNDPVVCSGQGTCKCGQCICDSRNLQPLRGKYCDCDDYACKRTDNKLCSGEDRGICECGTCKCFPGWRGDACQCPDDDRFCVDPRGDGQVCSGRGKCDCGRCKCDSGEFSGKYCEECPTCPGHRCEELRPCVECFVMGGLSNCSSLNCSSYGLDFVEAVKEDLSGEKKMCTFLDEARCTVVYQYYDGTGEMLSVEVQKEKVCPEGPDVLGWVLGVTGSIILAGLVMLIVWKIVTTVHDRNEYAKFENERSKARWHRAENPLYKPTISTFRNPMYRDENRLSSAESVKSTAAPEEEALQLKD